MEEPDYRNMVDELCANEDAGMSAWELTFIENMSERQRYTPKMREKIAEIWDKCIGNK